MRSERRADLVREDRSEFVLRAPEQKKRLREAGFGRRIAP